MIEDLIEHLRKYAKLQDSIDVERFDAMLSQIAELRDPKAIGLLIPFFNDDCKFPEVMYSIRHTIEMFDDETYTAGILKSLPGLWEQSPKWAKRLHYAILNSPSTRQAYGRRLRQADPAAKASAKELITEILETEPRFAQTCRELLAGSEPYTPTNT